MSLETVLHIGKKLRESEDNLRYFKSVDPCPLKKDGTYPVCINIPINEDFSFDWGNIDIVPESQRNRLYYLKFKTSGNDSSVKYIFGDLYFEKAATLSKTNNIEVKYGGYYRLGPPYNSQNSFLRGKLDCHAIVESLGEDNIIHKFRNSFDSNINLLESLLLHISATYQYIIENRGIGIIDYLNNPNILKSNTIEYVLNNTPKSTLKRLGFDCIEDLNTELESKLYDYSGDSVFIHFDFHGSKHWYEFDKEYKAIKSKILSEFVEDSKNGKVLKKTLYKTLCSGDDKNDIQFPKFSKDNKYKAKAFDSESLEDLFYAVDFTSKGRFIKGTDVKRIVLPLGENLKAEHYIDFLSNKDESQILAKNDSNIEPLFEFAIDKNPSITSFDLIFCKKGSGAGTPDTDLVEISGLEKSKLRVTMERINVIASEFMTERRKYLKTSKDLSRFEIEFSFQNILGTPQFDSKSGKVSIKINPKYESHLLKVLPLIYTDNYTNDEMLLSAFIQNVEYSVRSGDEKFTFLQFDLKFLYKIQNSQNDKFTDMLNSESYQIGLKLGKLAKPLKKKINAFEKRYVGLLTRHTSTKDDCIKFSNDIHEMLTRHEKTWGQMSAEVCGQLAILELKDYDKEKLAFGFFEGYFKYEAADKKKDFFSRIEKLLSDYEGNEELENEVERLQVMLNDLKSNQ